MKRNRKYERWIVKAGSQMVLNGGAWLIRSWMQQVCELNKNKSIEIIWVTSGAIASAQLRMGLKYKTKTLVQKQALSAIGQPQIMDQYNLALQSLGKVGSQVLLTAGDIQDIKRRTNLQNTFEQLLKWKILPIINENDAISTDEIKFGDNDQLAAQVAIMMKAKKLILLTDVGGLYDQDPNKNENVNLIPYLETIPDTMLKSFEKANTSKSGTGGIYSKLLAAKKAQKHGIVTYFVQGDQKNCLLNIAEGNFYGTQIGDS